MLLPFVAAVALKNTSHASGKYPCASQTFVYEGLSRLQRWLSHDSKLAPSTSSPSRELAVIVGRTWMPPGCHTGAEQKKNDKIIRPTCNRTYEGTLDASDACFIIG